MDRYDVLTVRESNGHSYFTKLGAMFPNRNGEGFTMLLDAVPAPVDGQFKLIVKRPQERDGQRQGGGNAGQASAQPHTADDDFVPF